jgi:hypothetical protein
LPQHLIGEITSETLGTIADVTCDVNWRLDAITELPPILDPHNYRVGTTMAVEEKAFLDGVTIGRAHWK